MKIKASLYGAVILVLGFISLQVNGMWGCGGSSDSSSTTSDSGGGTTTQSLKITGEEPTASVSLPSLALRGLVTSQKTVEEQAASGVTYHAEDLSGNQIGEPCTSGSDGTCTITGLTDAQLTAGYVIEGDNGMHAFGQMTNAEITEYKNAGTTPGQDCDTETDFAVATVAAEAGGEANLATACVDTIDCDALNDATKDSVGDGTVSADDLGGYAENNFAAHAQLLIRRRSGDFTGDPASVMSAALRGEASAQTILEAQVGSSLNGIPISTTITNFRKMSTAIKDSYCKFEGGVSPWKEVKLEAGSNFDPRAVTRLMKIFTPDEISSYEPEDFRGYARALPDLEGGFVMFGAHPEARETALENFRLGGFKDPTKAGAAMGYMAATFPPPPTAGNFAGIDFSVTTPRVIAQSAFSGWQQYVTEVADAGAAFLSPSQIYGKCKDTFSDPENRTAIALGGISAIGDNFMADLVAKGENFRATDHAGDLKQPPGGTCTSDADCMPCDICRQGNAASTCFSLTTRMGVSCDDDDDCDDITSCVGGGITSGRGGQCMCTAGVPEGAPVIQAGGTVGMVGVNIVQAINGVAGAPCGTGQGCSNGLSCSSSVAGTCLTSTFKKAPFSTCSSGSECESGTCSSNLCGELSATQLSSIGGTHATTTTGTKTINQPCLNGLECVTGLVCDAGQCKERPVFTGGGAGSGGTAGTGGTAGSSAPPTTCTTAGADCTRTSGTAGTGKCVTVQGVNAMLCAKTCSGSNNALCAGEPADQRSCVTPDAPSGIQVCGPAGGGGSGGSGGGGGSGGSGGSGGGSPTLSQHTGSLTMDTATNGYTNTSITNNFCNKTVGAGMTVVAAGANGPWNICDPGQANDVRRVRMIYLGGASGATDNCALFSAASESGTTFTNDGYAQGSSCSVMFDGSNEITRVTISGYVNGPPGTPANVGAMNIVP